jgi:hypothetical protein
MSYAVIGSDLVKGVRLVGYGVCVAGTLTNIIKPGQIIKPTNC